MALFEFSKGTAMFDATPIENMFILEFLPSAPEGFLRPYLYARMLAVHPELGDTVEDIARALHMDTEQVENAFLYWERQGIMQKTASNPPAFQLLPVRASVTQENAVVADREYYEYRNYTASMQNFFDSTDLLESHELRMANDWLNVLGLTQDAVLFLVEREKKRSRARRAATVFRHVDKTAAFVADRGAHTLEEVRKLIAFEDDARELTMALIKRLGIRRSPTEDELAMAQKWLSADGYTAGQVLDACEETVRSRNPSFAYVDAILENRKADPEGLFAPLKQVLAQLGAATYPTQEQLKVYDTWLKAGFQPKTVELAAIQLNRRNRHTFDELAMLMEKWEESGLFTEDAVNAFLGKDAALRTKARKLLEAAGSSRNPTLGDLNLLEQWQQQFSEELINCAAVCANGTQYPIKYMQKLLNSWAEEGIKDVQAAMERHSAEKAAYNAAKKDAAPAVNPALNYQQRTYTQEDFGDDFFFDPITQSYGGKTK